MDTWQSPKVGSSSMNTKNCLFINVGAILNLVSLFCSTELINTGWKTGILYLIGIVENIDIFIPPFKLGLITHWLEHLMPQQQAMFG